MKKVIIIGAGTVGKNAFDFLGADLVECFADNGKKGIEIYGKIVISVAEAARRKDNYLLLLAVTNYLEELKEQLSSLKVKKYYYFKEALYFFDGIRKWDERTEYKRLSLWKIYSMYGLENAWLTGEKSEYASFIAELFGKEIIEGKHKTQKNRNYVVNMPNENCLHGRNIFVLPWIGHPEIRKEHQELRAFYRKYAGRRCFIIGNGPSLKIQDLDKLKRYGDICFGFNVIHKLYARTDWRPDFICVKDPLVMAQNYDSIRENNSCPLFVSDVKFYYYWEKEENEYPFYDIQEQLYFSDDIVRGCSCGASVSYTAIQICAYMGFSEIYLLGMDCSNWQEHFDERYWNEDEAFREPDEVKIFRAYKIAEQYSGNHGFRIWNATRGGKLEVFRRVDFDSLFPKEV